MFCTNLCRIPQDKPNKNPKTTITMKGKNITRRDTGALMCPRTIMCLKSEDETSSSRGTNQDTYERSKTVARPVAPPPGNGATSSTPDPSGPRLLSVKTHTARASGRWWWR